MRKSKRFAAVALVATFGLVAAACGDDEKKSEGTSGATETTTACVDADANLKVGIAFDTGGRGDGTFNDSAGRGADKATCELGATIDEIEAATADDRQPNLETLTGNGDNPIIAVGFAFGDGLATVAAANPDTSYAIVDGFIADAPANITFLGFAEHEGSFLVGAAAALKSKSGHIGFIGGQEIDLIKKFEAGYTAGAKYVNPEIDVEVQYLGPAGDDTAWGSPDEAKQIANGWYADGVDVIYTAAGGSGQGTIEAAVESDKWAIGVDSDQYLTATPDQQKHILTSMLKRVDVAVYETIKAAQAGTLEGGFATYDLKVDGVGYSTSGGYLDDVVDQLEAIKAKIISGDITVPTAPE
ncbi:MAG TPA: BMP family ABC transporter substrate-binding protein [Ilumatobacteraceae bacterium]|nr:BMP family ABC transporter substrate-binding protein [Ilumatobacteraceae bacterium]